jgi:hypothetical protein
LLAPPALLAQGEQVFLLLLLLLLLFKTLLVHLLLLPCIHTLHDSSLRSWSALFQAHYKRQAAAATASLEREVGLLRAAAASNSSALAVKDAEAGALRRKAAANESSAVALADAEELIR